MSQEQREAPLEKFRRKIQVMKEAELEKKRRVESGGKGITWNLHFEKIDEKILDEEDRFVFENLGSLSREEFEGHRRKRMEGLGIIQSAEEIEKIMEGLDEQQRSVIRRVIKKNGGYSVKTSEQMSIDFFWQYMANRFSSEGKRASS